MATVDTSVLAGDFAVDRRRPFYSKAALASWKFVREKPLGAFGAFVLVLVIFVGIFSPWLARDGATTVNTGQQLVGPGSEFWLGSDSLGRDIYSRIVYGAQVTAIVGVGTVLLTGFISLAVGVTSGFFGGKVDFTVQRLVDIWMSFPAILLILTLVAILTTGGSGGGFFGLGRGPDWGPNPQNGDWLWYTFPRTTIIILVLGVVLAGGTSRVVRSAVFSVKANPYIDAARVVGATNGRIIRSHIIPNILPTVIVLASVQLGTAVLAEATLSFLGIGVTNFPTWGQMLSGQAQIDGVSNPHLIIFPGLAIFLAVFGFNMLGDALRDVLDPRLRGSR